MGCLSESQKRRWLALAQTFETLPPEEQEKLHNRMTEWSSLSARQRSQARLNYADAQRLAPNDKRAHWEAYQALSDEESAPWPQMHPTSPQAQRLLYAPCLPTNWCKFLLPCKQGQPGPTLPRSHRRALTCRVPWWSSPCQQPPH